MRTGSWAKERDSRNASAGGKTGGSVNVTALQRVCLGKWSQKVPASRHFSGHIVHIAGENQVRDLCDAGAPALPARGLEEAPRQEHSEEGARCRSRSSIPVPLCIPGALSEQHPGAFAHPRGRSQEQHPDVLSGAASRCLGASLVPLRRRGWSNPSPAAHLPLAGAQVPSSGTDRAVPAWQPAERRACAPDGC